MLSAGINLYFVLRPDDVEAGILGRGRGCAPRHGLAMDRGQRTVLGLLPARPGLVAAVEHLVDCARVRGRPADAQRAVSWGARKGGGVRGVWGARG